jgi:hypothetical protein
VAALSKIPAVSLIRGGRDLDPPFLFRLPWGGFLGAAAILFRGSRDLDPVFLFRLS